MSSSCVKMPRRERQIALRKLGGCGRRKVPPPRDPERDVRMRPEPRAAAPDVNMEEVEEPKSSSHEPKWVRLLERPGQVRSVGETQLTDHDVTVDETGQIR